MNIEQIVMEELYYLSYFVAGYATGFASCALFMKLVRSYVYSHKFYGIDTTESIKNAIVVVITLVWIAATLIGVFTRTPIDPSIHLIVGTVLGAYFGVGIFDKSRNAKK